MPKASSVRNTSLARLRSALLAWYGRHKRDLPWRRNRDAYRIWVSEIMLQQTRVAAVLEHYHLFLRAFPSVEALARAPQEQVLARWSGLGYYRRARMLHQASAVVSNELGGVVPSSAEALRKLPGVGRYTAAAIASIAFDEPVAVVDGNVERVLSRLDGVPRPQASAWQRAQELLDARQPGDWNQAMMELGATVCTPQNPQCQHCPVRPWCTRPGEKNSRRRPVRRRVQSERNLIERGDRLFLVQRPPDAAKMPGMWELPECALSEAESSVHAASHRSAKNRQNGSTGKPVCILRHSITDTDYDVIVVRCGLPALSAEQRRAGSWLKRDSVFDLPLTGLTRKILRKLAARVRV